MPSHRASLAVNSVEPISEFLLQVTHMIIQTHNSPKNLTKKLKCSSRKKTSRWRIWTLSLWASPSGPVPLTRLTGLHLADSSSLLARTGGKIYCSILTPEPNIRFLGCSWTCHGHCHCHWGRRAISVQMDWHPYWCSAFSYSWHCRWPTYNLLLLEDKE